MSDPTDLELIPVPWPRLSNLLSLFGLGLLAWGCATQIVSRDTAAGRAVAIALGVVAAAAWVVALVIRRDASPVAGAAVLVMALAGGALVAFAPVAMVFPAVAVFAAAVRWRLEVTLAVGAAGWLSVVVAEAAVGLTAGVVLGALAAVLAGTLVGIARRQAVEDIRSGALATGILHDASERAQWQLAAFLHAAGYDQVEFFGDGVGKPVVAPKDGGPQF